MIRIALLVGCIVLAPAGNLLLKWGMDDCGSIAQADLGIVQYYCKVFAKPQILVGAAFYIVSALMWMAVLSMMDISAAYPIFVSSAFLIVTVSAVLFFHEHVNVVRILGMMVVVLGIVLVSQSTRWSGEEPTAALPRLCAEVQDSHDGQSVEQNIDDQG
jgi:multidrug transporter EmrE-like cation transporter